MFNVWIKRRESILNSKPLFKTWKKFGFEPMLVVDEENDSIVDESSVVEELFEADEDDEAR